MPAFPCPIPKCPVTADYPDEPGEPTDAQTAIGNALGMGGAALMHSHAHMARLQAEDDMMRHLKTHAVLDWLGPLVRATKQRDALNDALLEIVQAADTGNIVTVVKAVDKARPTIAMVLIDA